MELKDELKMEGFRDPYQQALLNVMFTGTWVEASIRRALRPYGLTEQQYNVLRILKGQHGRPISLGMVQERMLHKMSNATRIVERLRQKGCLKREVCQENRRQVEVTITPEGERMLDEVTPKVEELVGGIADRLRKEEAKQLNELLEKLRA